MTTPLNIRREDVAALIGVVDRDVVDQILATEASLAEIAQAVSELEADVGFDDQPGSVTARVARVRILLEPIFERRDNISRGRD